MDTTTGKSQKFPAVLGEFGSFMNDTSNPCANTCLPEEGRVRSTTLISSLSSPPQDLSMQYNMAHSTVSQHFGVFPVLSVPASLRMH